MLKNKLIHLLYLSPSTIPSSSANSIHVMKMCEAFASNNYKTTLFAYSNSPKQPITSEICTYYGVDDIFKIILFQRRWHFNKLRQLITILLYVISNRIEIVYSRNISLACSLMSTWRIKTILEFHDLIPTDQIQSLRKQYEKGQILKIVLISNQLAKIFLKNYNWINSNDVIVAHDAVNINQFENESQLLKINFGFQKDGIIVGYIGSLYHGRGIDVILEISKVLKDINFIIVGGDNTQINKLRKDANYNNVMFYGHIPNSEIARIYSNVDLLLMPYQDNVSVRGDAGDTSKWMSPMKLFEYMASGKPIISSNIEVLQEILIDKYNCLLVDPTDINSWVKAIRTLLSDNDLKTKVINNAKSLVYHYTWQKRVENIMNTIKT